MLALEEAEIKAEAIPINMHQGKTAKKKIIDKGKKPTVIVHVGRVNETTTLCITTEEY